MNSALQPRGGYILGFLGAAAVHAAILFGIKSREVYTPPEFGVEVASTGVEVALVAALPGEEQPDAPEEATPEPPQPEPEPEPPAQPEPPPEPQPEPEPEPQPEPEPVTPPEVTETQAPPPDAVTEPEPPKEPPKPQPTPAATPKPAAPKPKAPKQEEKRTGRRAVGDGSSPIPGTDATTAAASTGALTGQPGYLRNPHPAYPEEARRLGQEGVVHLRVTLDERGNVVSVVLARSSGFPLLDERALTTVRDRWRFKPARRNNVAVGTDVVVPIRFRLDR